MVFGDGGGWGNLWIYGTWGNKKDEGFGARNFGFEQLKWFEGIWEF